MTTKPRRTAFASATAWRRDAGTIALGEIPGAMALMLVNRDDVLVLSGYGMPP
ncbi:hypothetical protein AB4156_09935 [Cupriavidus sp. 2MCAB6]|uniref:hypothetical protein n=1 Tax=Cupriavidus sp. 2MCAB6 TaxID=3232981 RepID=UPI003F8DF8EB